MAGTKAKCNRCGAIVTVPFPAGAATPPGTTANLDDALRLAAEPASIPRIGTPASHGASLAWVWLAVGGVALALLFLVGGIGAVVALRRLKMPSLAIPNLVAQQHQPVGTTPPSNSSPGINVSPASSIRITPSPSFNASGSFGGNSNQSGDTTSSSAAKTLPGHPGIPNRAAVGRRSSLGGSGSILPQGPIDTPSASPAPVHFAWNAKVDPPLQALEYKKGKISVPFDSHSTDICLPAGPSNFVLVTGGGFDNKTWQVLDLRTAKQIGRSVQGDLDIWNHEIAFSPDGRYAAAPLSGHSGRAVGVWSFATGKLAQEITLSDHHSSLDLCFGGPHQLAISYDPDFSRTSVGVWDLQTGSKIHEMSFSHEASVRIARDSLASSPGGKYLLMITGDKLGVVEFATGDAVGQIPLPAGFSGCEGIAFSPDGRELALDVKCNWRNHLLFIDFSAGRIVLDREVDNTHFWYDGPRLEWMPDKSGILYKGHLLIDRVTGDGVWTFPRTDSSPRRMIRPGEMLVVLRSGRGGKTLQTADLPIKEIMKGIESVRAGGEAIDSALPPLTTPDLFSAVPVTLPNGFTAWSAVPDPAGPVPPGLDRDMLVAKEGETLQRLIFAGPQSGKIVVQKEVQPIVGAGGGRRGQRQMIVERYDVASGSKGSSVEIPFVYRLVGASPSGNFAVVGYSDTKAKADRIDVVGLAPKKHIAGWRPYAGDPNQKAANAAPWSSASTNAVSWLNMLDDEHIVTVSTGGKLVNWKLPECKAVYVFEQFGEPLALSPGRKYLAGAHNGEFRLFDASTGQCVGDLESPVTGVRAVRAAFSQDGRELSAIIDGGEDKMLVRWNLTNGKIEHEFPLPGDLFDVAKQTGASFFGQPNSLEYRGNKYALLDNTFLIDLERRAVIWRYELNGTFVSGSPDEKTWFCTRRDRSFNSAVYLTTHETPSASVLRKAEAVQLENQLVLYPGMSVRLLVDLTGVNMQNMEATVRTALQESLENRGIVVSDAAPLTLSVLTGERATGDTIGVSSGPQFGFGYSPFFRSSEPQQTISKQQLVCRFALSDASGKVRWFRDRSVTMRSGGFVQQGNAEEQLRKEMHAGFTTMLASTSGGSAGMPTYVFASLNEILGGESQLVFNGEAPLVRQGNPDRNSADIAPATDIVP